MKVKTSKRKGKLLNKRARRLARIITGFKEGQENKRSCKVLVGGR